MFAAPGGGPLRESNWKRSVSWQMVVGTNFGQRHHPGWTANLLAHPDASIEVGPERLSVTGELVDEATWERLWPRFVAVYPGYANYLTRCAPRKPRMFRLRPRP